LLAVCSRSFAGASGDGVEDLKGIAGRPDYPSWLGADKVWLPEDEAGRVGAMRVVGSTRPECGGEIEYTGCLRPYEGIVLR